MTISDGSLNWYGLGPVSVLPEYQRQGIGKSLIQEGLSSLKGLGGQGCVLVGEPNYYKRFGFRNVPDLIHEGIPQKVFLALPFSDRVPHGQATMAKNNLSNSDDPLDVVFSPQQIARLGTEYIEDQVANKDSGIPLYLPKIDAAFNGANLATLSAS